jgi:glycosyltransferase involved in cell wall biosynthesis
MTQRPHVLYVTPIFGYPAYGGPRLRTYNTLRALARIADVTLYLTQQPDVVDREAARDHVLTFCRGAIFPPAPPRPPVVIRAWRRIMPSRLRARLMNGTAASDTQQALAARTMDELRGWIVTHRPDLVWLGFGGISYHLVQLKELTGTPLVLETECVWSRFILRELPFESDPEAQARIAREGAEKEAEERNGARQVDITTAVSEVDAEYFRSISPDPARVLPLANVIDVSAYTAEASSYVQLKQPAVLFAGTLSTGTANVDAGVWLVDEIMPLVWRKRPDVHVYLVGRSPAAPIVARRGPKVHVTGEVRSIVPYMRSAAAAVVPLRWESGTRFKILEAFACRTPVISTTLGAEGLEVEHGRHLLLADDQRTFADAVLSVLDNPDVGGQLVGPAFQVVAEKYDLRSAERQIEAILSRLGVAARERVEA